MPSIDDLMREIEQLRAENDMLKMLLKENGIARPTTVSNANSSMNEEALADTVITKRSPFPEKVSLFLSLFQGRPDVYAHRLGEQKRTLRLQSGMQKRMGARYLPEAERKMCGLFPCGILLL